MFEMFRQMFLALKTLFSAAEKGAKALEHLATWAEEATATYAAEARIERQQRIAALKNQRKQQTQQTQP